MHNIQPPQWTIPPVNPTGWGGMPVDVSQWVHNPLHDLHIAFILDASSSMSSIRQQVVSGFNEHVQVARSKANSFKNVYITLIHFNENVYEDYFAQPLFRLSELNDGNYMPYGNTALYDAIGYTIEKLKKTTASNDDLTDYFVVILSDGENNASKHFSSDQILVKTNELKLVKNSKGGSRWTFAFIGANQDLYRTSQALGIDRSNMLKFSATADGTQRAMRKSYADTEAYFQKTSGGINMGSNLYSSTDKIADADADEVTKTKGA